MSHEIYKPPPLITIPNSLHEQLEQFQSVLAGCSQAASSGDMALVQELAREGTKLLTTFAGEHPEQLTLVKLVEQNQPGFTATVVDKEERCELHDRKFFGITVGKKLYRIPYHREHQVEAKVTQ